MYHKTNMLSSYQLKLTTLVIFTWSGSQDIWIGNIENIVWEIQAQTANTDVRRARFICTMCIPSKELP